MKRLFLEIEIKETWGLSTKIFDASTLIYFRFDEKPSCVEFIFDFPNGERLISFDFTESFSNIFSLTAFVNFLTGQGEDIFYFFGERN